MDSEDFDIDLAAESAMSSTERASNLEPVVQPIKPEVAPNIAPNTQPAANSPLMWNIGNSAVGGLTTTPLGLFNTNFYPEYAKTYADRFNYNFEIFKGPANPVFIDKTLSYWDIANNLHLEFNPNGILWRVNAAGIPTYEDLNDYHEQNSIIEAANNRTMKEINPQIASPSAVKGTGENTTSRTKEENQTIAVQADNGLKTNSSEEFSKMHPEAIYKDDTNSKLNWGSIGATPVGFSTNKEEQFTFTKFDRNKAVDYALKYDISPNLDYPNFGDNDCTNFVSQCWAHAGIPVSTDWFCTKIKKVYTNSWTDVEGFANYMVKEGYCYISYSSNDAKIGDVIQFYNDKDGWHHSAIITEIDEAGNIKYSGHSESRNNYPLSEVYPKSGEQIRFLCVYQRLCDYAPDIATV